MKNILKWFAVFFIVMTLVAGLELTKFSLFRPPEMGRIQDHNGSAGGPPSAFHPNEFGAEKHPSFGPPPTGMESAFALADLIDLFVYVLILLPLFYGADMLHKRTLRVPGLNRTTTPLINLFKPDQRSSAESNQISTQVDDYLVLDNHMLDQLL